MRRRGINKVSVSTGTFLCSVLNVFCFLCHKAVARNVLVHKSSGPVRKNIYSPVNWSDRSAPARYCRFVVANVYVLRGNGRILFHLPTNRGRNRRIFQKFTESLRFFPTRTISFFNSSIIDLSTHVFPTTSIHNAFSLSAANSSLIVAFSLCIVQPFVLACFSHKCVDYYYHSKIFCNSLLNSFRITLWYL